MDESPQNLPKKKRSSRKGLPKRFECQHEGCGRKYSRAEHLQRHALNHEPQQRYRCLTGGCNQVFARKDLFHRHVERHEQSRASVQPDTTTADSTHQQMESAPGLPQPSSQFSVPSDQHFTGHADLDPTDWTNFAQPLEITTLDATQDGNGFASWLLSPPGSYD